MYNPARLRGWVVVGVLLVSSLTAGAARAADSYDREDPDPAPAARLLGDDAWMEYLRSRTFAFGVPVDCGSSGCGEGSDDRPVRPEPAPDNDPDSF